MSPSVSIRLLLTQSDARLAAFAQAGHERAFEALVQRYRRPLLGYCRRLLLSEEHAEDALQQALLQAWLALRAGTEVEDIKPWLYRIVHNTALNVLRISGYDYSQLSESLSGADAPQADLDRRIAVREALAGLAALPQMQREALLRTAVEGRTHQQVARDLGLSEPALRGLVYRARATLRATAGAVVPPPILTWALASARGTSIAERLAELGAGGGSAGVAGLLMKGGAVAVTASMLAGGIAAMHIRPSLTHRHSRSSPTRRVALQATGATAVVAEARATVVAWSSPGKQPPGRHAVLPRNPWRTRQTASGHRRSAPQPSAMAFTTKIAPSLGPTPSSTRDGPQRRDGGGSGDHEGDQGQVQSTGLSAAQGATNATHGGDGGREDVGQLGGTVQQQGSGGDSSGHETRDGGSAEGGDSSGESPSSSSATQGAGNLTGTSQAAESPEHQASSSSASPSGTNGSSKDKEEVKGPPPEGRGG
jgi:RNA polymerase sigma factor (sigma-70 family)